jgi:poly(3-hydroxybutyrate) depolymerase
MEHQQVLNSQRNLLYRRLWSFIPTLCLFYLAACNTTKTIPIQSLADAPAGDTSHFVFPTLGANAEAFLTRPAGAGPFPLMILLHGHTLAAIGAESIVSMAEAFARDLCYAGLAVSLPGYGATDATPVTVALPRQMGQTRHRRWGRAFRA